MQGAQVKEPQPQLTEPFRETPEKEHALRKCRKLKRSGLPKVLKEKGNVPAQTVLLLF